MVICFVPAQPGRNVIHNVCVVGSIDAGEIDVSHCSHAIDRDRGTGAGKARHHYDRIDQRFLSGQSR